MTHETLGRTGQQAMLPGTSLLNGLCQLGESTRSTGAQQFDRGLTLAQTSFRQGKEGGHRLGDRAGEDVTMKLYLDTATVKEIRGCTR